MALGGDESTAMVWERCSPKPWLLLGDTCREQTLVSLKVQTEARVQCAAAEAGLLKLSHCIPGEGDRWRLPGDAEAGAVGGSEAGGG